MRVADHRRAGRADRCDAENPVGLCPRSRSEPDRDLRVDLSRDAFVVVLKPTISAGVQHTRRIHAFAVIRIASRSTTDVFPHGKPSLTPAAGSPTSAHTPRSTDL